MSEDDKTVRSSETLEAVPSAPKAHQASGSSPAVTKRYVRTLQDVQREINKINAQIDEARKEYQGAL